MSRSISTIEHEVILVCTKVTDMGEPRHGSHKGACSVCQAPIWIPRSSLKATPMCTTCCALRFVKLS